MNENENILNDIKRDMLALNEEFKTVELELADYSEKIEQLSKRREQIRGQYTGLYNILTKYKPQSVEQEEQPQEVQECCCDGHCECEEVDIEEQNIETDEPEKKEIEETTQTEVLSEKDVAKVKDTLSKMDDTPDYLK